jgi:hypothetical protein
MGSKDDIARRQAEATFAHNEQRDADILAREERNNGYRSILAKIADQRALRLAKKPKDKPINGKKPG